MFEAHPIPVSAAQAQAVGLPIRYVEVGAEPSYKESYVQGMRRLAEEDGIEAVVTGVRCCGSSRPCCSIHLLSIGHLRSLRHHHYPYHHHHAAAVEDGIHSMLHASLSCLHLPGISHRT